MRQTTAQLGSLLLHEPVTEIGKYLAKRLIKYPHKKNTDVEAIFFERFAYDILGVDSKNLADRYLSIEGEIVRLSEGVEKGDFGYSFAKNSYYKDEEKYLKAVEALEKEAENFWDEIHSKHNHSAFVISEETRYYPRTGRYDNHASDSLACVDCGEEWTLNLNYESDMKEIGPLVPNELIPILRLAYMNWLRKKLKEERKTMEEETEKLSWDRYAKYNIASAKRTIEQIMPVLRGLEERKD